MASRFDDDRRTRSSLRYTPARSAPTCRPFSFSRGYGTGTRPRRTIC